jgi:hypothetical protein
VVEGGEEDEAEAPEDVDDAGITKGEAQKPDGGDANEGHGCGEEEDRA